MHPTTDIRSKRSQREGACVWSEVRGFRFLTSLPNGGASP